MKFVMQKNRVVGGISGHFISFKKGEPTSVPREMWADVQAAGAVPESQLPEDEEVAVVATHDPVERQELIFTAFKDMMARNKRGDFSASGLPNAKIVSGFIGFEIGNKERDDMWTKYMASKREEE